MESLGIECCWAHAALICGITLAGLWLVSGVVCAQPVHRCVLVGVFGWHIAGRRQVGHLRQGSSTWWCCCCRGGGQCICVFEALRCDNHACCQGQIGVCKRLLVLSARGLLRCRYSHIVLVMVMWWCSPQVLAIRQFSNRYWCSHTSHAH